MCFLLVIHCHICWLLLCIKICFHFLSPSHFSRICDVQIKLFIIFLLLIFTISSTPPFNLRLTDDDEILALFKTAASTIISPSQWLILFCLFEACLLYIFLRKKRISLPVVKMATKKVVLYMPLVYCGSMCFTDVRHCLVWIEISVKWYFF